VPESFANKKDAMKKILLTFLLLAVVLGLTAATSPRVSRATLTAMEKSLDGRISKLWQDNPFLLLGATRGVYLDGYGAVFTAEINLVANPISLMQANLTKEDIAKHRQRKLERIPILKKALMDALVSTAASLDTVPPEESITIVAFLPYYSWEDISGLPTQLTVQAQKKKVLEAQHAGAAALDAVVKVSEN
jgi:hypothetical protein